MQLFDDLRCERQQWLSSSLTIKTLFQLQGRETIEAHFRASDGIFWKTSVNMYQSSTKQLAKLFSPFNMIRRQRTQLLTAPTILMKCAC